MPARVRAVVFDLDGTLVDSYGAIASSLNHARGGWGLPPLRTDEVRLRVGRGLETLIAELVGPDRVEDGVARFREHYARVWPEQTRLLRDAARVLAVLDARGVLLGLASNKPARFSVPILEKLGIAERFGSVQGPDRVGATKPDPVMIHACLEELGAPADESVYVGDMVLDVDSAARAGIAVLLVPGGSSPRDQLVATGCPVLQGLGDLPRRLTGRD